MIIKISLELTNLSREEEVGLISRRRSTEVEHRQAAPVGRGRQSRYAKEWLRTGSLSTLCLA
ncbi:MAG TPA: hypothetical protein VF627_03685, partial [Abditibacterium sp.]